MSDDNIATAARSPKSSTSTTLKASARDAKSSDKPGDTSSGSKLESKPARLRILDKEVQIACRPGEEEDLMQAAAYIDRSMRDLRHRNNTSSIEKIAIVTAINTANALLKSRSQQSEDPTIVSRMAKLNGQLDELLTESDIAQVNALTIEDNQD